MSTSKRDEWLRDVESRQRNTVFPDTVTNEGEFYRGIANRPLSRAGKVGFVLIAVPALALLALVVYAIVTTATQLYPDRGVATKSILLTLCAIGGGAALFIAILYVGLRHGVEKFAAGHRGRFRRS
jgi:hypothetical protein